MAHTVHSYSHFKNRMTSWSLLEVKRIYNLLSINSFVINPSSFFFFHSLSFKCKSKITGGTLECKSSREHLKNWKISLSFKLDLSLDLAIWVKKPWKVIWATQNDRSSSPSQGIEWNSETGYFLVHRRTICSEDLQYHALYCWYVCKVESTRVWMLICTALIMILCGSTMCSIENGECCLLNRFFGFILRLLTFRLRKKSTFTIYGVHQLRKTTYASEKITKFS